jgi:hypothetical protein
MLKKSTGMQNIYWSSKSPFLIFWTLLDHWDHCGWLDKRIFKTKMKFWAVLGSHGCREKKPPYCHNYATFWGGFFNVSWAIFYFYFFNFLKII